MSEIDLQDRISAPLRCTNCRQTVRVSIDRHATGNLTITCPNCKHDHHRYVENGVITEDRWRSSSIIISSALYTATATADTMIYTSQGTTSGFLRDLWYNSDSTGGG